MKKMFLLFSHTLTPSQIDDAKESLEIDEFVYLPSNLQKLWSNIPQDIDDISKILIPLEEFLKDNANKEDVVLIQGDFGAVFKMVNFSKKSGLIPVYSTTKREIKNIVSGENEVKKISVFLHVKFRRF